MGEASDAIERHIRQTRKDLERNVEDLESRLVQATDWRRHVYGSPFGALTLAFAGGLLASVLVGSAANGNSRATAPGNNLKPRKAWANLQNALLAVASMELRSFAGKALAASGSRSRERFQQPRQRDV